MGAKAGIAFPAFSAEYPKMQGKEIESRDRALGAMLGLATGDAVGTTLEFQRRDSYQQLTDMVGGGPFDLMPGQWTDDTAMSLALADSLAHDSQLDESDLMQRFVSWMDEGAYSCTGSCFDIGITTRRALADWKSSGDPVSGSTDPRTAGNGSLMRLAPVAVRHWRNNAHLVDVAARQSQTTHGAAEAVQACIAFAEVLSEAIKGSADPIRNTRFSYNFSGKLKSILNGNWVDKERYEIASSGYVMHSLEAAFWCVNESSDFRESILLAANLGDDADTTAAITGQLAGAIYGAKSIPAEWLHKLAWRDQIVEKAELLFLQS
ncbi:ADP-ribosylglycohydrolase family protein [Parasphingorhabdus sp.]|uniref:ADP-ribosylglycohydrolase family protein n=1 Tax=Parasphingorhabdus sp. TaxID=2709688 RepID=UPI003264F2DB